MHPLEKMMSEPIVALSFESIDPPSTDGTPRRRLTTVPKEIFDKYRPGSKAHEPKRSSLRNNSRCLSVLV
jgi:hypothetical protein